MVRGLDLQWRHIAKDIRNQPFEVLALPLYVTSWDRAMPNLLTKVDLASNIQIKCPAVARLEL
jgi:hypothetical protein